MLPQWCDWADLLEDIIMTRLRPLRSSPKGYRCCTSAIFRDMCFFDIEDWQNQGKKKRKIPLKSSFLTGFCLPCHDLRSSDFKLVVGSNRMSGYLTIPIAPILFKNLHFQHHMLINSSALKLKITLFNQESMSGLETENKKVGPKY